MIPLLRTKRLSSASLFRTVLVLSAILFLPTCDASEQPTALATIVTSRQDLFPARLLFYTARQSGDLPSSTEFLLLSTPAVSKTAVTSISQTDNLTHLPIQSSDTTTYNLVHLFSLPYSKIIFLTPHSLVLSSLSTLLDCPDFCAPFLHPCTISTNLLVLKPNDTTHTILNTVADGCETGAGRENAEGSGDCAINEHFGQKLINGPVLVEHNLRTEASSKSGLLRIPMGFLAPHHLFYPRMRWELSDVCSPIRVVDFSAPYLTRPSFWPSYIFAPLSSTWREARQQHYEEFGGTNANIGGLNVSFPILEIAFCAVAIMGVSMATWQLKVSRKTEDLNTVIGLCCMGVCTMLSWMCAMWVTALDTPPGQAVLTVCMTWWMLTAMSRVVVCGGRNAGNVSGRTVGLTVGIVGLETVVGVGLLQLALGFTRVSVSVAVTSLIASFLGWCVACLYGIGYTWVIWGA